MFCISCGKEIEEGSLFCEHCGAKQNSVPPAPQATPEVDSAAPAAGSPIPSAAASPVQEKKPMSRNTKIALGAVAVAVAVVVALKAILGAINDPNKTISRFLEAIREEDSEAFAKVVEVVSSKEIELNEQTLAPFFAAYTGNDVALSNFQSDLLEDLTYLDRGLTAQSNGSFIRLAKNTNLLFSSYKIQLTPVDAMLYSEFEGTTVKLSGAEYPAGREGTKVLLLPGVYDAEATCVSEETGAELTMQLEGWNVNMGNRELWCSFDYTGAYFETNYRGLEIKELYIDGKQYTGDLEQFDPYYGFDLYPVNSDSEIRAVFRIGETEFEQTFQMEESTSCWLEPSISDELKKQGESIAADVGMLMLQLSGSYDTALLERLSNTYGQSSPDFVNRWSQTVREERSYYQERAAYADYYSYGVYNGMEAGEVDSSVWFDDGEISLRCEVPITYQSKTYYSWSTGEVTDTYDYSNSTWVEVDLIYSGGEWIIVDVY